MSLEPIKLVTRMKDYLKTQSSIFGWNFLKKDLNYTITNLPFGVPINLLIITFPVYLCMYSIPLC